MSEDTAESRAIRRRWIGLAELVGVAGLILSAFALWMNWHDRQSDLQEHKTEQAQTERAQTAVTLRGKARGESIALADPQHDVQTIDVRFPSALGLAPQTGVTSLAIPTDWFGDALLKATDGSDAKSGRLPVLITAHYWRGDQEVRDTALYDLVWRKESRFLRGHTVRLDGMVLAQRTASPAALDTRWAREKPSP